MVHVFLRANMMHDCMQWCASAAQLSVSLPDVRHNVVTSEFDTLRHGSKSSQSGLRRSVTCHVLFAFIFVYTQHLSIYLFSSVDQVEGVSFLND